MAVTQLTNRQVLDGTLVIADFSATGTPSSSTFLRGDNTWTATTLSAVLTIGNDAGGTQITTLPQITNTVTTRFTRLYLDSPLAQQAYLYGSNSAPINGGDWFNIAGSTASVSNPSISLSVYSGLTSSQSTLYILKDKLEITSTDSSFPGIVEAIDYSANYTSLSHINKGYAAATFIASSASSGKIIVGNSSNVATAVAMSGDATINNTGVITAKSYAYNFDYVFVNGVLTVYSAFDDLIDLIQITCYDDIAMLAKIYSII